jgi:hypothetical protein
VIVGEAVKTKRVSTMTEEQRKAVESDPTARAAKMGLTPAERKTVKDPSGSEGDSGTDCSGEGRDEDDGQQAGGQDAKKQTCCKQPR